MTTRIEPTIEQTPKDPMTESVERHPAFGMIAASRVSCGGKDGGEYLFGSDFKHHEYVRIVISKAQLMRGLHRDWPFGRNEIVEVALSESQWATFVSTLNMGQGAQCTITAVDGRDVPGIAHPTNRPKQFSGEFRQRFEHAQVLLKELHEYLSVSGLSATKRQAAKNLIDRIRSEIGSSIDLSVKTFGEFMEDTTEKAKTEISAYVAGVIQRAGLAAIAKGEQPFELMPARECGIVHASGRICRLAPGHDGRHVDAEGIHWIDDTDSQLV